MQLSIAVIPTWCLPLRCRALLEETRGEERANFHQFNLFWGSVVFNVAGGGDVSSPWAERLRNILLSSALMRQSVTLRLCWFPPRCQKHWSFLSLCAGQKCHRSCNGRCWGPKVDQCQSCKYIQVCFSVTFRLALKHFEMWIFAA